MANNTYSIVFNEREYTAEYIVSEDTLTVFLPDGSIRETELRGLKPETAVRTHLVAHLNSQPQSR